MPEKPRVKAPKQRSAPKVEAASDRRRLFFIAGGAAILLVAVAGAFLLLGAGGDSGSPEDARAALTAADCTLEVVPALAGVHSITDPDATSDKWNTDPPTSGPHNADTIIYGAYTEPLQLARLLHNLEHGAIYILYGEDVPAAAVTQLQGFYEDHENGTVLAPYPKLGDKIALGAWLADALPESGSESGSGVLATCSRFDEAAYGAFFDAFQYQGPESSFIRPSDMEPGEQ